MTIAFYQREIRWTKRTPVLESQPNWG